MGCGCNKNGAVTAAAKVGTVWKVTLPDGGAKTFTNEPDARLLAARNPGAKVSKLS